MLGSGSFGTDLSPPPPITFICPVLFSILDILLPPPFGTAMATLVARNGFDVCILGRKEPQVTAINTNHRNPDYLSSFQLPPNLRATTSAIEALTGAEFVVHCVPLQASQDFLLSVSHLVPKDAIVISTSKGLHEVSLEMMCDIIPRCLPGRPVCFLSGPSFAKGSYKKYSQPHNQITQIPTRRIDGVPTDWPHARINQRGSCSGCSPSIFQ